MWDVCWITECDDFVSLIWTADSSSCGGEGSEMVAEISLVVFLFFFSFYIQLFLFGEEKILCPWSPALAVQLKPSLNTKRGGINFLPSVISARIR